MDDKLTVLIIDDEFAIRKMLRYFLEDCGCDVSTAESAAEGLNQVEENKYDAAIVDIRMPDMVGTDFILKAHEVSPDTKYFIHTGLLYYKIPEELVAIGITQDFIIHKPVLDMNDIYQAILKQTGKQQP